MSNVVKAEPATIARAAKILRAGGLVAFPTETVYGLGANALDPAAVRKIFAAKDRPAWDPLIIHVAGIEMARALAQDVPAELTARFWPGPLTLVLRKLPCVPDGVTAGRPTVALRMPDHPVAAALLAAAQIPIAAPSANRFGRPSPTCARHVADDLGDRVDLILDGGPTDIGVESTILDMTRTPPVILRPGGIPREQLDNAAVAPAVEDEHVTAPGMTLKHYAPRARVEIFETEAALRARAAQLTGKHVGIVGTSSGASAKSRELAGEVAGGSQNRRCTGEALETLAHSLFAELRRLDNEGVEVILALLPPPVGLGLAVRDRLTRAAGSTASL